MTKPHSLSTSAAGAIILKIAYGYDVEEDLSDPYVALANEALDKFSKSTMLGEFPVDFLPIRKPSFALFGSAFLPDPQSTTSPHGSPAFNSRSWVGNGVF